MSTPLLAGMEVAKYGAKMYNASRKPEFAKSALGQYYAKKKAQGLLGDKNVKKMANQYGAYLKRGADDRLSNYKGSLINKGIDSSVAGIRGASEVGSKTDQKIADYASMLTSKNEESKSKYAEAFAKGQAQDEMDRYNQRTSAFNELVGGISGSMLTQKAPDLASIAGSIDFNKDDLSPLIEYMKKQGFSEEYIDDYIETKAMEQKGQGK